MVLELLLLVVVDIGVVLIAAFILVVEVVKLVIYVDIEAVV